MNILFLTNGFPEKNSLGNGIFNYHRYKRLKAAGHNVTVCKLNHLRAYPFKESYCLDFLGEPESYVKVVNYYQIPKVNIYLKLIPQLKKIVSEFNIDIVHVHFATQSFAAYFLNKALGIPYVITAHGGGVERRMTESKRYANITRKAISKASHVIYVSNNLRRSAHNNGLKNSNESVIYNGVEPFDGFEETKKVIKDLNNVIYVGSLKDIKRAQYLPDIFRSIRRKRPAAQFKIIGDGVYKKLIKEKLKEYDLVDCTYFSESHITQKEVFGHLQSSDILIQPSLNEGFGCVLIEAMMCGCQIVASSNGGMPEVLGDVGSLVDDGEDWIERFAAAVVFRLNNPVNIERLVSRAKSFNWDKTVQQEIEVYKKVLNG